MGSHPARGCPKKRRLAHRDSLDVCRGRGAWEHSSKRVISIPTRGPGRSKPANFFILGFQPSEPWECGFLLCKAPSLWNFALANTYISFYLLDQCTVFKKTNFSCITLLQIMWLSCWVHKTLLWRTATLRLILWMNNAIILLKLLSIYKGKKLNNFYIVISALWLVGSRYLIFFGYLFYCSKNVRR